MTFKLQIFAICAIATTATCLATGVGAAAEVADFYRGKRIDFVIGSPVGGGYDLYARLVARHLGAHIPGNPTIVSRNMPGAGTLVAANWLFNAAPRDGTVLASVNQTVAIDQALGANGIEYDVRKFAWVGTPTIENRFLTVWSRTGVKSIEDATKKEVVIGAAGVTSISVVFPQVSNNLFRTKFRIIAGYPGANDILLAMERGEVDGIGSSSAWGTSRPDWLRDHRLNVLFQVGTKRSAEWPDAPLLTELAKDQEQREVLDVISEEITMGYPLLTTPDVPSDRLAALRNAFDALMSDPSFLADAAKAKLAVDPVRGVELQQNAERVVGIPPEVESKVKDALRNNDVSKLTR